MDEHSEDRGGKASDGQIDVKAPPPADMLIVHGKRQSSKSALIPSKTIL